MLGSEQGKHMVMEWWPCSTEGKGIQVYTEYAVKAKLK